MDKTIDKIIESNLTTKEKVDKLLELDATLYTNLGTDSTAEEKKEVKRISKIIYKSIKKIDKESGEILLKVIDA